MVSLHLQHPLTFTARVVVSVGIAVAAGAVVTVRVTSAPHAGTHTARTARTSHVKATAPPMAGTRASAQASPRSSPAVSTGPRREGTSPLSPAGAVSFGDLTWSDYQGYALPVSATSGPLYSAGGISYGYADTPAGAVLAATNIGARTEWEFGPGTFGPTIEKQVIGSDAMTMLQDDVADYDQDSSQLSETNVRAQFDAYSVDRYTPSDAMVSVVQGATGSSGASVYEVTTIEVQWLDGDWRVVAPAGGQWTASQVPSPAGYTPFPSQPQSGGN
jgi:hypothetical protein